MLVGQGQNWTEWARPWKRATQNQTWWIPSECWLALYNWFTFQNFVIEGSKTVYNYSRGVPLRCSLQHLCGRQTSRLTYFFGVCLGVPTTINEATGTMKISPARHSWDQAGTDENEPNLKNTLLKTEHDELPIWVLIGVGELIWHFWLDQNGTPSSVHWRHEPKTKG